MESVAQILVAWAPYRQNVAVNVIAADVRKHRATVCRWVAGVKRYGIEEFIRRDKSAKKGRRVWKTRPWLERCVLRLRVSNSRRLSRPV